MSDELDAGLYHKYAVYKDGEIQPNTFVLKPEDDDAARKALRTYADETDDEELATDLDAWLAAMEGSV